MPIVQLNRCHGTLSVYQSNISKHKLDLKQSQYNDIDKRYFNQLIQLKVHVQLFQLELCQLFNLIDTWIFIAYCFGCRQLKWQIRTWTAITVLLISENQQKQLNYISYVVNDHTFQFFIFFLCLQLICVFSCFLMQQKHLNHNVINYESDSGIQSHPWTSVFGSLVFSLLINELISFIQYVLIIYEKSDIIEWNHSRYWIDEIDFLIISL